MAIAALLAGDDTQVPSAPAAAFAGRRRAALAYGACALVALFAVWSLCNPYFGAGDGSLIYIARAMADLDPSGVGQDLMFRLDGQSAFTLFTPLFRMFATVSGVGVAAKVTAVVAMLGGFAATAVLAARLAKSATRIAVIVCVGALPGSYGGYQIFSYLSAEASPRPFAEAFVLLSVAALLANRPLVAIACVAAATLLHPIMALAGAALLGLWLVLDDRRWLVPIVALVCVGIGAALAGIAPFDRIVRIVDPEWRAILTDRNPHLFPSLWLDGTFGRYLTRIATLLLAAFVSPQPLRRLFLLAIVVGFLGIASAYLFGERLSILLALQAQPWRMAWLTFALASAALAICCHELWTRGTTERLALLCLVYAWAFADQDRVAVLLVGAAVGLHAAAGTLDHIVTPRGFRFVLAAAAAILALRFVTILYAYYVPFPELTLSGALQIRRGLAQSIDWTIPAIAVALCAAAGWYAKPALRILLPCSCIAAGIVLGLVWDQRSNRHRLIDEASPPQDLVALLSGTPGAVYWINGLREPWSWLARPNWLSSIQGAGIVFDRDLAIRFRDRARRAIDLGLADDDIVTPLTEPHAGSLPVLAAHRVERFCAASDAPAWIVAPDATGDPLPAGLAGTGWTSPIAKYEPLQRDGGYVWQRVGRYWVVSCGGRMQAS